MLNYKKIKRVVSPPLIVISTAAALFAAAHMLYSAYCALTWGKFGLTDYGKYSNMLWNCGRLEWFRYLSDHTYLMTHLSFTLAPIGFLYYLWDHPFLLSIVQWLLILLGCAITVYSAYRYRLQADAITAIAFFYVGYRLTQGVMLSEFHGVCAYFPCMAWLYYCLAFKKSLTPAALALMLGVREDAFLLVLPMLLYFAVRDRWKMGYVYLLISIVYGVLAITVIYPAINGYTLFERRAGFLDQGSLVPRFDAQWFSTRGRTLVWTLLPAVVLLQRRCGPAFLFPLTALLTALASGSPTQQSLGTHYGASVMACLPLGIVESLARRSHIHTPATERTRLDITLRSWLLVIVTVIVHMQTGFIKYGAKHLPFYQAPYDSGRLTLAAARRIPRQGLLVTEDRFCGLTGNRADLLSFDLFDPARYRPDYYFTTIRALHRPMAGALLEQLQDGRLGTYYFDGHHVILGRDGNTNQNAELLKKHRAGYTLVAATPHHGGENVYDRNGHALRYWEGDGSRGPINLSYGSSIGLASGTYEAVFRFRAAPPERTVRDSWGWLSIHERNQPNALALVEITSDQESPRQFREQRLAFSIDHPQTMEFRVAGADARLWLEAVWIEPVLPVEE